MIPLIRYLNVLINLKIVLEDFSISLVNLGIQELYAKVAIIMEIFGKKNLLNWIIILAVSVHFKLPFFLNFFFLYFLHIFLVFLVFLKLFNLKNNNFK